MSGPQLDLLYVLVDPELTPDNSPVLQSQVVDRIRMQRNADLCIGVVTTVDDPARFAALVDTPLRQMGVPVHALPDRGLARNLLAGRRMLRLLASRVRHVYVRSIWGAFVYRMAFPIAGPPLIYDFRGDMVAESADRGASRLRQSLLRLLSRAAFAGARTMLAVSSAAAEMLAAEYGKQGVVVMPSGVDVAWFQAAAQRRDETRRALGVAADDVVLVYAGGLNPYQMIPEMLALWKELGSEPSVRFLLLLAHHQPTAGRRPDLEAIDEIPRLIHMSVPRSEIPAYLAAADIGFLLRKEHTLNVVASPVKFGEYLASGLAIVTSHGVGDTSRVVTRRDLGILVRTEQHDQTLTGCRALIGRVRGEREGFRQRAWRAVQEERWDWEAHSQVWRELLGRS